MTLRRRPTKNNADVILLGKITCSIVPLLWLNASSCSAAPEKQELPEPIRFGDTTNISRSTFSEASSATQTTRTLSLQASFDQAQERSKEVIAAKYNLPIAKAAIKIAAAIPNPHFSLQYGWGPAYTIIIAGNPQQFGWQQQLQTAGKRTKQVALAKANYASAEFQIAALIFDLHNRVRRAYADLAASEAYAALIEAQRNVALELHKIAQSRFQAGKGSKSDELQAALGVMQFDTQRNQAVVRLQKASAALCQLIGEMPQNVEVIDVDDNGIFKLSAQKTDLVPSPEHELAPLDQLLPAAYQERQDLKLAIQQAHADRKALTLAKSQRIPDLFIESGYQFTTFRKNQPFNLSKGPLPPNSPGVYLNVTQEHPLFYQHQGEVAQAKWVWKQDFDQIEQVKYQIAADIITAYESVSIARANITRFQRRLIPESAQLAKLARKRYQIGKSGLAEAILAKQQYQQILSSYFDSVVSYQNAWADLERAMGVPLKL